MEDLEWSDGRQRCSWANPKNERYVRYHDEEWGRPVHDDGKLFELLLLECFQAGLSWECVLNKREGFRRAFAGFDLEKVCAFTEEDVERLMQDGAIIRHRRKIEAAIGNARVFHCIQQEFDPAGVRQLCALSLAVDGGKDRARIWPDDFAAFRCTCQRSQEARHEIRRLHDDLLVPAGRRRHRVA